MMRTFLIILATAVTSVGLTSTYFLAKSQSSSSQTRALDESRARDFFKPLQRKNDQDYQEMRPRW